MDSLSQDVVHATWVGVGHGSLVGTALCNRFLWKVNSVVKKKKHF